MVKNGRQGDGSVSSRAFLVCCFRILFDHFKNICLIKPSACLAELILVLRNLDLIVNSTFFSSGKIFYQILFVPKELWGARTRGCVETVVVHCTLFSWTLTDAHTMIG